MRHCLVLAIYLRARVIPIVLVSLAAAVLIACGGDEDTTETPLPEGTPVITDGLFEFPAKEYAVEVPEGWTPDANSVRGPGFTTDIFFSPDPAVAGAKASISVTLETLEESLTTESYLDLKLAIIRQLARDEPQESRREVAGIEAGVVQYGPTTADVQVDKTDVIFTRGEHGWTVTLTVPAGQGAQHEATFDSFLGSLQLLDE